jgi:hypothetical protein
MFHSSTRSAQGKKQPAVPTSVKEAVSIKRKEIQKLKNSVPRLSRECAELKKQLHLLKGKHQFHQRKEVEEKIEILNKQLANIQSGNVEKAFEEQIKPFLLAEKKKQERVVKKRKIEIKQQLSTRRKRSTSKNVRVQRSNGTGENSLLDDFNAYYNIGGPAIYMTVAQDCENCGGQMQRLPQAALLACEKCGVSCSYVDASSQSLGFNDEVEYSTFAYRRVNHFVEWLNSFQARETTDVPQEVLQKVMRKLYQRRVMELDQIEPTLVRQILKELTKENKTYRKYYDNTMLITCKITGRAPPRLTPTQETQLKHMFLSIQPAFEKHCPKDRKNFISYSYCLYKFCELLGLPYTQYFSLLKGKEKLSKMDSIWVKICKELNWEYIASI